MNYYLSLALILVVYMSLWFGVSLIKRRNDVADEAWGLGFVLMAGASFVISDIHSWRGLLVLVLVTVWGLRLAWHINRRHKGKPEDYRYQAWREQWGSWFYLRSFGQIYLFQGILLFVIAMPVFVINYSSGPALGWLDLIGLTIWLVGFWFESVSDAQLAGFIKNPANKGQLMRTGLWRYSRHPNYFGEVTQWWGIWLLALTMPFGLLAIVGPITITILILKISGIPMLEKKLAQHPDFRSYRQQTSVFLPWPPRRQ